MTLSPKGRVFVLRDSLTPYTDDLRLIEARNPVALEMNGRPYSVHISAIHPAGAGRGNRDEQRIQVRRSVIDRQCEQVQQGAGALFIGFFADGRVFTAWEPAYVFSQHPDTGGSIYARRSHHSVALEQGAALRRVNARLLDRETSTISLPSEQLGFYLENWQALHEATTSQQLRGALTAASRAIENGRDVARARLGNRRRRVTITRTAYVRDPEFTRLVLQAYGHACCICGKQLGLVQAAHIVPHSHDDATDDVSNGLALCVEHHKLFDDGLILIRRGGIIKIDPNRVEHLRNIDQGEGLDEVDSLDGEMIGMPEDADSRPDDQLLARGARIRLGKTPAPGGG